MPYKKEFIFDMVHNNPGESGFETAFASPEHLVKYGYNSQVFKHINCVANFDELGLDLWPEDTLRRKWFDEFTAACQEEMAKAKQAGLKVFYHIDLFVLPQLLLEVYRDRLCDENGLISIDKEFTLEVHRVMFREIFRRFKFIDGLIIRTGETYLFDTPYHHGNGAVLYGKDRDCEQEQFVRLIKFLREEICLCHNKYVFFRSWDCFSDKFHADMEYYLDVTNRIEPHEKLLFSIKHTKLDFWRYVDVNPCLGVGRHRQIIEVQCQREYEGKGAYPSYIMDKVINGFPETKSGKGLRDLIESPLIAGLYGWSRGGGWYGPYISNELWCDMNAYVIGRYFNDSKKDEVQLFNEYCTNILGADLLNTQKLRDISLMASQAILSGRYCRAYDSLGDKSLPSENWMRDDFLGGFEQLEYVLEHLFDNDQLSDAIEEKRSSVELWEDIVMIADSLDIPDNDCNGYIRASARYGLILFSLIYHGWQVMAEGYVFKRTGKCDRHNLAQHIDDYDRVWKLYQQLKTDECCASLYKDTAFQPLWQSETSPGLRHSIDQCRDILSMTQCVNS